MSFPNQTFENQMEKTKNVFLEVADSIGAKLCRDAIWAGVRCNWLGDSMEFVDNKWTVAHRALGPELYNGTSGIALFLARLFAETNERIFRLTSVGALRQALSRMEDVSPHITNAFYSGLTGIAYVSIQLGEVFNDQDFIHDGLNIIENCNQNFSQQQSTDVIGGSAGIIPVLLNIYGQYSKDSILDLAIRHGDHLLSTARKSEVGWSWNTLNITDEKRQQDLTGFAHGVSGVAWALIELYRITNDKKYLDAAKQGFRYERHWFNPQHSNWPDFRNLYDPTSSINEPTYMIAWCHGAPGIGLSRLRAFDILRENVYKEEAVIAIRTTEKMVANSLYGGEGNYSLCHGLAGNAELLIYAGQVLEDTRYVTIAEQIGQLGIKKYHHNLAPWPGGVMGAWETPNLMLGLAGTGYFYLRLYDAKKIPPVVIVLPA